MAALGRLDVAPTVVVDDVPSGDICVFYEPDRTVIRLFGRVDAAMRTDLVEAAVDVVNRAGPVIIEVASDADVDPAVLRFLRHVVQLCSEDVVGAESAAPQPQPLLGVGRFPLAQ